MTKPKAKKMVTVHCNRVQLPDGGFVALFGADVKGVDVETLPVVSLSRVLGKCLFRIDKLQEHDTHAPTFHNLEEANTYIERVFKDIATGLIDKGIVPETEIVDLKAIAYGVAVPFKPNLN